MVILSLDTCVSLESDGVGEQTRDLLKVIHAPCRNDTAGSSTGAKRGHAKIAQEDAARQRHHRANSSRGKVDSQKVSTAKFVVDYKRSNHISWSADTYDHHKVLTSGSHETQDHHIRG
jgi:hypothetical protein